MELLDAFAVQAAAEVAGHGGGDHAARLDVVVEALEQIAASQPGTLEPQRPAIFVMPWKFDTGMMPGTTGTWMPAAAALSRKRRKSSEVEEELGDAAIGAGIDLALQILEVGPGVGANPGCFSG